MKVQDQKNRHPQDGTLSFWESDILMPRFPKLSANLTTDVCIVGGGIAGLLTAYALRKEGKSVVLLEASELCAGQTGRTTAHFSFALDDRYYELEKDHGAVGARLAFESHHAAIEKTKAIVAKENIACDLVELDGYLCPADNEDRDEIEKEFNAARRAGVPVEKCEHVPGDLLRGPCLKFPGQVQLHPLKYLKAITERTAAEGTRIFTNSRVINIAHEPARKQAVVKCEGGFEVSCANVVVATNSPTNDIFAIHTKQAPYRSYVVGFEIPRSSVPRALYWDTLEEYHYVRTQPLDEQNDLLIVGGEDHKTGQEEDPETCFTNLETWTRDHFPMAKQVRYRWSGQVMEPVDGLAYLGHNPLDRENIFVITGDSGHGMTHATIGAILITDQILQRENKWEKLYSPSRISLKASGTFLKENANVALQYGDWLTLSSHPKFEELRGGEGLVYRDGIKPVAAYKAETGEIKKMSAVCPHLGGIVRWNSVEKSWDCPCHGSRFRHDGEVIEGPASTSLTPHGAHP